MKFGHSKFLPIALQPTNALVLARIAVEAPADITVATLTSGQTTVIASPGRVVRTVPMRDIYTTKVCFGAAVCAPPSYALRQRKNWLRSSDRNFG